MGNMNIAPAMITASPEVREAIAKGVVSAKDTVAQHAQAIKAVAVGTAAGMVAGALSPIPGGAVIGGAAGAAIAAGAEAAKRVSDPSALKKAAVIGLIAGPLPGLAAYAFCSGKAQSAWEKMKKFIVEHPEALLAKAG